MYRKGRIQEFSHMRKFFARLAVAGVVAFAASGAAHADTVNCPVTNAMRTITTPVPGEWWTTPIVAALSETRIANVGGRVTLECVYGNAGIISRYAPDGQVCAAAGLAFNCSAVLGAGAALIPLTPAPLTPAPVTRVTGALDWLPSYRIDLDNGVIGGPGEDLWYQAVSVTEGYITPLNGALIGSATVGNNGFAGCSVAALSSTQVPLSTIRLGSYVCVKTSEGRISEFRLNNLTGSAPQIWSIGYTTWQ
jgi:hypothetical protein